MDTSVTGVLATIYSLIGLILGILTLREKDIYRIFPVLGTILNVVALGGVSFCCIWEAVCNGYSGTEALDHTAVI